MDAARSNTFGRLTSDIVAAIRASGPSPEGNARLAVLLKKAKEVSFPRDRLEATFARAQGSSDTTQTSVYEALCGQGIALIIECATDSTARTHAKVKELFNRSISAGSRLSSVGHLFERKGVIRLSIPLTKFDEVFEIALDAGAEEVRDVSEDTESEQEDELLAEGGGATAITEILCDPSAVQKISQILITKGYDLLESEQRMLPSSAPLRIKEETSTEGSADTNPGETAQSQGESEQGAWVSEDHIRKLDKLIEALEESADCHKVWSNVKNWP
ncbi:unnamed protein product [Parajaminaea phylloscopi]